MEWTEGEPSILLRSVSQLADFWRSSRTLDSMFDAAGEISWLTAVCVGVSDRAWGGHTGSLAPLHDPDLPKTPAAQEGGTRTIIFLQWHGISGHMLSAAVSVQQQLMTQQLLNSHKQKKKKFGVVKVCKPGQTPLFRWEWQHSAHAAKRVLVESMDDSMQSLRVMLFKDADGPNCYKKTMIYVRDGENAQERDNICKAIKGSEVLESLPHPERRHCITSSYILLSPHPNNLSPQHCRPQLTCSPFAFTLRPFPIPSFPPCTPFSGYWPRPPVPVPGGCRGGWGSHSQGCSVHSSHRPPWGPPLSTAAGCLPGMKKGGGVHQWKPQQFIQLDIESGSFSFSTCDVFV